MSKETTSQKVPAAISRAFDLHACEKGMQAHFEHALSMQVPLRFGKLAEQVRDAFPRQVAECFFMSDSREDTEMLEYLAYRLSYFGLSDTYLYPDAANPASGRRFLSNHISHSPAWRFYHSLHDALFVHLRHPLIRGTDWPELLHDSLVDWKFCKSCFKCVVLPIELTNAENSREVVDDSVRKLREAWVNLPKALRSLEKVYADHLRDGVGESN